MCCKGQIQSMVLWSWHRRIITNERTNVWVSCEKHKKLIGHSPPSSPERASRGHNDPALRTPIQTPDGISEKGAANRIHNIIIGYQLYRSECAEEKKKMFLVFPVYSLLYTDAERNRVVGNIVLV